MDVPQTEENVLENGIYSFKIEGRLKDTNYVKNITAYYRQILDKYSTKISSGESFFEFIPNPEKSFNRGFTDYFLVERNEIFNFDSPKSKGEYLGKIKEIKKDCFKLNNKIKISPQDGLTFENDGFLVNKVVDGYIYPNKKLNLKTGMKVFRNNDTEFEKLLSKKVSRKIKVDINITKDKINLTDSDGIYISLDYNFNEIPKNSEKMKETFIKQFSKLGDTIFMLDKIKIADDIPFLPISEINELRRVAVEKLIQARVSAYKKDKQNKLNYTKYYKTDLDYKENIYNSDAKSFYEKCGAKVCEFALEKEIPQKQVELMRTKHCIKYALSKCKSADKLFLIDDKGVKYPLKFDCKNCEMIILS